MRTSSEVLHDRGKWKALQQQLGLSKKDGGFDDNWYEDNASDACDIVEMGREHERRRDHFHTIGYRDGLIAGKEASAQEGFNVGFKQSVVEGHKLGLVRGITSALSSLPEVLREKLASSVGAKKHLEDLHKSSQSISTNVALRMFNERITSNTSVQSQNSPLDNPPMAIQTIEDKGTGQLETLSRDVDIFLQECPVIKMHDAVQSKIGL